MDPRLLQYYNAELQHLREMGASSRASSRRSRGGSALDSFECADPYVERLLEGFAFLAARVQLKIDAEFPRFTQHLLRDRLSALSGADAVDGGRAAAADARPRASLAEGFAVPRGSVLRSAARQGRADAVRVPHRARRDAVAAGARPTPSTSAAPRRCPRSASPTCRACVPRSGCGCKAAGGSDLRPARARRRCRSSCAAATSCRCRSTSSSVANVVGVVVRPATRPVAWQHRGARRADRGRSASRDERGAAAVPAALLRGLPAAAGVFRLSAALSVRRAERARAGGAALHRQRARDRHPARRAASRALDGASAPTNFALFCTPAINLFPRRADRIHLTDRSERVPRRRRPHAADGLRGLCRDRGDGLRRRRRRRAGVPAVLRADTTSPAMATRRPTTRCSASRACCRRGSAQRGAALELRRQRGLHLAGRSDGGAVSPATCASSASRALCTNRDLPLHVPVGKGATDFTLRALARRSRRCAASPGRRRRGRRSPRATPPGGSSAICRSTTCRSSTRDAGAGRRGAARAAVALCRPRRRCASRAADRGRALGDGEADHAARCRCPGRSPSAAASRSRSTCDEARSKAPASSCSARCSSSSSPSTCRSTRSPRRSCGRWAAARSCDGATRIGQRPHALSPAARTLQRRAPHEFDFFQALRRHRERCTATSRASGTSARAARRAGAPRPGAVDWRSRRRRLASLRARRRQCAAAPRRAISSACSGPNGPLPLHLTEYARERLRNAGDRDVRALPRPLPSPAARALLPRLGDSAAGGQPRPARATTASPRYVGALFGLGAADAARPRRGPRSRASCTTPAGSPTRRATPRASAPSCATSSGMPVRDRRVRRGDWMHLPARTCAGASARSRASGTLGRSAIDRRAGLGLPAQVPHRARPADRWRSTAACCRAATACAGWCRWCATTSATSSTGTSAWS